MEKFGIFELLDALSALMQEEKTESAAPQTPKKEDAAFAPPAYGSADPGALEGLLQRHEEMSRRIDKKS